MKRFICFLALFLSLAAACGLRAAAPLGEIARLYPFKTSRLVVDPSRARVYAVVPDSNSVAVIDAKTLALLKTVFIGSNPVDLSISADDKTLYVANNGSTAAAVGVLDLDTLTTRSSFPLPSGAIAIAAGLGNRVYVSASDATAPLQRLASTIRPSFTARSGRRSACKSRRPILRPATGRKDCLRA